MFQEAIQYVVDEARKSAEVKIIQPLAEPENVYYLQAPGGALNKVTAAPPLRRHVALDLTAVAEFAESHSGTAEVWFSREKVVCVLDRSDARESVTLALEFSPQLRELQRLEQNPRAMDQRSAVYLLRTTFRRCLGRAGDLLNVLRAVRFNAQSAGEGVVQHGKSSIGKTLAQEITGAGNLPEYVVLEVPVFTNASLAAPFPVECALEPDAATQTFKIVPLPNEIERAVSDGERLIAQTLAASLGGVEVPAHYGKP